MKKRFDLLVHERYPQYSRRQIQSWIIQGKATLDKQIITKVGTQVPEDALIELSIEEPKYVSRAGFKLEKALDHFNIDVKNKVILDAGLSTGGFTDCLLQRNARKVYGVDVGYGQVHEKIRADERVVVLERTNLRHLREVGEKVDLVTLDLSFISALLVMNAVEAVLKENGGLMVLIKPQFEAKKEQIGRGGIIKDPAVHNEVIDKITSKIESRGFICKGVIASPLLGSQGNKEFLSYFIRKI